MTTKESIIQALRENPEGMSRRQLQIAADKNIGTVRAVLARMQNNDEITVETVDREYGPTRVHKLTPRMVADQQEVA